MDTGQLSAFVRVPFISHDVYELFPRCRQLEL